MKLIDVRTNDGSRQFACLPRSVSWRALRHHLLLLPGAKIVNFVVGGVSAAWIDFDYRGFRYFVRSNGREFCFFVGDPQCPDLGLYELAAHCERLLAGEQHA